jgi:D-serine deaminase-like pyridoxal phosphate-dependent protein
LSESTERLSRLAEDWVSVLAKVRTPCLIVDTDAVEANCRIAGTHAAESGLTIRPHAKTHGCSKLLLRQLALGSESGGRCTTKGVTCATAEEAVALAQIGFDDILLANEVVSRDGAALLAQVARRGAELTVAVDSRVGVVVAAQAAEAAKRQISVLIDLNVGSGRCGVSVESPEFLELARLTEAHSRLRLAGIMAYTGRANYFPERADRTAVADSVKQQVEDARSKLRDASLNDEIASGGSTGTFDLDQGLTELQLGSYALLDGHYAAVGLTFRPALFCAATVISLKRGSRAILDCGWKAVSGETGLPVTPAGLTARTLSAEHLTCGLPKDSTIELGQIVLVIPAHLDTAVTLHERLVATHDGQVEEWPVDLRRSGSRLIE